MLSLGSIIEIFMSSKRVTIFVLDVVMAITESSY
jgi:histone H3/H4